MTVRLLGPNAAAFMTSRRLELELEAGRGSAPATRRRLRRACSTACSGWSSATGGVRVHGDDG